ncbi:MAG: hypothetical protein EP329_23865 [Deltaproteobacteria bacterium]|nr:MAG: hypothetical protein EP329_23865 [Deltaproteobacteria bacterium]
MSRDARHLGAEAIPVQIVKVIVYLGAGWLILAPLATPVGIGAAGVAVVIASVLAGVAVRKRLRPRAALTLGAGAFAVGWLASSLVRNSATLAGGLGVEGTVWTSDALFFGVALLGALFSVRYLAQRSRLVSVLEAAIAVFSVVYTFASHRYCQLNQPRDLVDWLLEQGISDPQPVLYGIGTAVMLLAIVMFMRRQSAWKTLFSMAVAIGVGVGVYFFIETDNLCNSPKPPPWAQKIGDEGEEKSAKDDQDGDPAGGQDKDGDGKPDKDQNGGGGGKGDKDKDKDDKGGKGQGGGDGRDGPQGGGGSGDGDSPYGKPPPNSPQPVAVVAFHDDYDAKDQVLYFRQQVQSRFDQTHLSVDSSGKYDKDVITTYPTTGPVTAGPGENPDLFTTLPTSVYLLADHPQPISLGQAAELRPLDNPNPDLFVASYDVTSYVLPERLDRLLGRKSVPDDWDEATAEHYTEIPDDPRYRALSDEILRDIDLRFYDDDLMKALLIKEWLEKHGYYTLKETHTDATDPTASFLFGTLRGYCVHFANAAVFLFRSQGIAARVAVGYGVDTSKRAGGSNLLILGNMAHAWPEIHLEGVGWITFDVYPEQSDEPPQQIVDQSLESMLGEIARKDPTGGRADDPDAAAFPFGAILLVLGLLAAALGVALYGVKVFRRLAPLLTGERDKHRWAMRAILDTFADVGVVRQRGETREAFARRVADVTPTFDALTMAHLRAALGHPGASAAPGATVRDLYRQVRAEYRHKVPLYRRLYGALNPIGWLMVR